MQQNIDSLFVLRNLIEKDFKVRYRNMSLGLFWSMVNPLVMMSVLTFVFTVLLPSGREYFPLFVLIGLLPYNFFALSWQTGAVSIVDNSALVKKVPLRRQLLPLAVVFANSIHYFIQLLLLLIAIAIVIGPNWQWLWLPVILAVQLLFTCGAALLTAAVDVYVRDTRYFVESATLVLFWMLPIFYGFDAIDQNLAWLYEMNPMAAVIFLFRTVLLDGDSPNTTTLAKLFYVSSAVLVFGVWVFNRLEKRFTDFL